MEEKIGDLRKKRLFKISRPRDFEQPIPCSASGKTLEARGEGGRGRGIERIALKSANILRRRHRTDKTDLSIVATGLDERLSRAELRGSAILIRASDVTVCIIVAEVKYRGYIVYIGGA